MKDFDQIAAEAGVRARMEERVRKALFAGFPTEEPAAMKRELEALPIPRQEMSADARIERIKRLLLLAVAGGDGCYHYSVPVNYGNPHMCSSACIVISPYSAVFRQQLQAIREAITLTDSLGISVQEDGGVQFTFGVFHAKSEWNR